MSARDPDVPAKDQQPMSAEQRVPPFGAEIETHGVTRKPTFSHQR